MHIYKNGNYTVIIMQDGTKVRYTNGDNFIPAFAENCDVKITDKCSQGCTFCSEGCTKFGKHANLFEYPLLLNSLHPYTEMALNGNDLDHPQLEDFLAHLKSKKVFANITVNQNQFLENIDKLKYWQEHKLIYGIGVSVISGKITRKLIKQLQQFNNVVIHTIAGILTEDDIEILADKNLKILILGYKELRRGEDYFNKHYVSVSSNMEHLKTYLPFLLRRFQVVSFDNLAITQLSVKDLVPSDKWEEFYMGDDGHYTFYIDLVKGEFAKNSLSKDRYPIGDMTIDQMFNFILQHNEDTNS